MILDAARDLGVEKWTVAEIDQLRRKLLADHGEAENRQRLTSPTC